MLAAVLALSLFAISAQDLGAYDPLCAGVAAEYDSTRGGFVTNDMMPATSAVELAFQIAAEKDDAVWRQRGVRTVDWAITLFDSVGGGFYDSQKDAKPAEPFFGKHTTTNAERFFNLLDAWHATNDVHYRKVADRVIDYADRVLLDGRGGFVDGQVGDRQTVPESNGVMIRAWLSYAALDGNTQRRGFAWKSLDRLWSECWVDGPGMLRKDEMGAATIEPQLMDQVEMGRAYVWAAHLAGREVDLAHARTIGDQLLTVFEAPGDGFRSSAMMDKNGKIKGNGRKSDENARAVRFLAELAAETGDAKYRDAARRVTAEFDKDMKKSQKLDGAEWALALRAQQVSDLPERVTWKEPPPPKPKSNVTNFPMPKKHHH